MYSRLRTVISVAALAVVAGACGSDSPTQPSTQQVTLNQALAELSLPALNTAATTYGGFSAITPTLTAARCPYDATAQSYVCTTVTSGGLTFDQSFTLLTAGGAPQAAFDAATTASVRTNTTISGDAVEDGVTYSFDGDQELTLAGLQESTHTLDGTGTLVATADDGAGTSGTVTLTETITGLQIAAFSTTATTWPKAGTIAFQLDVDLSSDPPSTTSVTMTFNGTSTVHVVVVSDGATSTCDVDFASPNPSCG
jgi:hypothetical protein